MSQRVGYIGAKLLRLAMDQIVRCQFRDDLGVECLETVDLDAVDLALDVRGCPILLPRSVLHYGQEMTLPRTICTSNELGIRMPIFADFLEELGLRREPLLMAHVDVAHPRSNGSAACETSDKRTGQLRRRI